MTDESNYSKREIDYHFDTINEKLDLILAQTTKTNGRVTVTEKEISTLKNSGKIANWAFGLTVPIILTLVVWIFFNQLESLKYEINRHEEGDKAKWDLVFTKLNLK